MTPSRGGNHDQDATGQPGRGGAERPEAGGPRRVAGLRVLADRYSLIRAVAAGPGWECHLAEDLERGQQVRLRLVTRELAAREGFIERVHQHARAMRELSGRCPAIANLRDLGPTGDGSFFLVMERDEGQTVTALVQHGGPVALDESLRLTIRIGEAVEAAHHTGLIDGRLDPGRAIVRESGAAVHLVDFGLDRAIGADPAAEQVPWLAPEIAWAGTCSERADVYGVGGMLYVLLTGRPPAGSWTGAGARQGGRLEPGMLYVLLTGRPPAGSWTGAGAFQGGRLDPVPPGKLRHGLPRRVEAIVLRALEPDPARRHEDVSVLLNDLSESIGLLGRRDRAGAGLWRRFGRWQVATGGAVAAAAMAGLWLAYPSADALVSRSLWDGARQSEREGLDPARAIQPHRTPSAGPPSAPDLPTPDFPTAATPGPSQPPFTAVPLPSPGPAVGPQPPPSTGLPSLSSRPAGEPRPTRENRNPRPARARRAAPTNQMPAPTTVTVESPTRPSTRARPVRPAEREAPPRSVRALRVDRDDPGRPPASAIPRPAAPDSPHPAPLPREAPARDAGEDPSAIIDWLLRDRR
jgi:Protein kinase domain